MFTFLLVVLLVIDNYITHWHLERIEKKLGIYDEADPEDTDV